MMRATALACLFVSKDGRLSVQLVEPPLPEEQQIPSVPPGMAHAARALGIQVECRVFKRTVEGSVPVYEEI